MNCRKAQNMFVDALYDEASPEAQLSFQRHIESCPSCAQRYEDYRGILGAWDARLSDAQPRRSVSELLLMARMEPRQPQTWRRWMQCLPIPVRLAATASVLVGILFAGVMTYRQIDEPETPRIAPSGVLPDRSIVENGTGFFRPLLGSNYDYRDNALKPSPAPTRSSKNHNEQ